VAAAELSQPKLVGKELSSLCDAMESLQNSLSRVLPFIADSEKKQSDGSAVGKITLGMKGLAKSLEKTAARLGTMPTKCADPAEYVQRLLDLFAAAFFLEQWVDHFAPIALEHATLHQQLLRASRFFYDVVCAFVVHDLNSLLSRHMRKASRNFVEATE